MLKQIMLILHDFMRPVQLDFFKQRMQDGSHTILFVDPKQAEPECLSKRSAVEVKRYKCAPLLKSIRGLDGQ